LEFRCAAGDWTAALAALDNNLRSRLVGRPDYRRQRAVLLTARALAQATDRDHARTLVLEAVKLAPTLIPAAALAGRLLAEAGELRRASRIIEKAWQANPHPDLAEVYAHLRFGDSARDRLARVENLARKTPRHIESALIVARAAIDAQEFAKARAALEPHVSRPTQRIVMLMAELEQAEHGDEGRARGWMARAVSAARDPVWTADGYVSDRWLPVSPISGRLDAFQWKVPFAELGGGGPVIEEHPHIEAEPPVPPAGSMPSTAEISERPAMIAGSEPSPPRAPSSARTARRAMPRGTRRGASPRAEPVIPLVHAPDDPGPDREREREPAPEPTTEPWWHPRQLFR
jgi:HemY protein